MRGRPKGPPVLFFLLRSFVSSSLSFVSFFIPIFVYLFLVTSVVVIMIIIIIIYYYYLLLSLLLIIVIIIIYYYY